jgi:hypothetical protein
MDKDKNPTNIYDEDDIIYGLDNEFGMVYYFDANDNDNPWKYKTELKNNSTVYESLVKQTAQGIKSTVSETV